MKKFTEALKKAGIYDSIIDSIRQTNEAEGNNNPMGCVLATMTILKVELMRHDKLFDIFMDEVTSKALRDVAVQIMKDAEEQEKVDALNDVDMDDLFKKATEKNTKDEDDEPADKFGCSGLFKNTYGARHAKKQEEHQEQIEDALANGLLSFLNAVTDEINKNN